VNIVDFLLGAPLIIQIVAGSLGFFSGLFLVRFFVPAIWIWFQLGMVSSRLRRLKKLDDKDPTPVFARNKTLSHLWTEYKDTLHKQRALDPDTGTLTPPIWRSTVPAAMIFTTETLVDTRLAAEFFKHLPGLFTGIGIIGTFSGLIQGLQAFKVSENAAVVRNSLEVLMHGVYEAFMVSAAAIFLAMVATFVEKWLVTALYRRAEEITFELDSMFESGAGEEYLARLVRSSEDAADQTKILKDALVTDLERILSSLTEQQIRAHTAGTQALSQQFAESLTTGLQGPLQQIADAFKQTSTGNSQAVTELLTDVLAGFSERLQELFGGQITGINQLQQQTIQALQAAVAKLDQMASNVETASAKTSEAMGQKLVEVIGAMESRQQVMNDRMSEFVEQIRTHVRDSQSETNQKVQTALAEIGEAARAQIAQLKEHGDRASTEHTERESRMTARTQDILEMLGRQVESVVGTLQNQSAEAASAQIDRENRMTTHADETVSKLASLTESLMGEMRSITSEVRSAVDAMRNVTADTVARMNSGAETLFLAADEFTKAGQSVAGVLQQATSVSERLVQAAGSVSTSSTALQSVVADYATTRETLATMLSDLRSTVENAKRDATLTSDILARIESASQALGLAQKDAEEYLIGISDVLGSAHAEFATSLKKVLGDSYQEFYARLSGATGLLRQAIEELALATEPVSRR
jgi:MotA/TolQ/ExbB proton channel family